MTTLDYYKTDSIRCDYVTTGTTNYDEITCSDGSIPCPNCNHWMDPVEREYTSCEDPVICWVCKNCASIVKNKHTVIAQSNFVKPNLPDNIIEEYDGSLFSIKLEWKYDYESMSWIGHEVSSELLCMFDNWGIGAT